MTLQTTEKQQMEAALDHLMYQFRHMKQKYDLIVTKEIHSLYDDSKHSFEIYQEKIGLIISKD